MKKTCRGCKKDFESTSYRRQFCDKCKKKRQKEYEKFQEMEIDDPNLEEA